MNTYKACYYSHDGDEVCLTTPDESGLTDEALMLAAMREAARPDCGLIGSVETDADDIEHVLTADDVRACLKIGDWRE